MGRPVCAARRCGRWGRADGGGRRRRARLTGRPGRSIARVTGTTDHPPVSAHTVLADADGSAYSSLRQRPDGPRRALRDRQGAAQAGAALGAGRLDAAGGPARPGAADHGSPRGPAGRLIPLRVGRMAASPYGFLRGTAIVMAEDVARLPATGITPGRLRRLPPGQLRLLRLARARPRDRPQRLRRGPPGRLGVGPAPPRREHLGRRAAERRDRGRLRGRRARRASRPTATRSRHLADLPLLARSYQRLDVDRLGRRPPGPLRAEIERAAKRARQRTSDRALPRFTARGRGPPPDRRGAAADHPGARRRGRAARRRPRRVPAHARPALAPGARRLHAGRHRAQGGRRRQRRAFARTSRCSRARRPEDVVFLQLKQARRSVLARYVHGESAWHAHQGQRVVEYQQALQTVSDPLLGWTTAGRDRQYYVRQFRNMKGTVAARLDRRGRARRLRGHRRAPARQGPRPHQRCVDDRGLRRPLGASSTTRCAGSPGRTPTRPRPTTPRSSPP